MLSRRAQTLLLYAVLVILSVGYRMPALVNAATVDADAAIVGLQARHLLRGEWSWFLYGSGYQTSVDSCVAALFFALLGATSLALILSTLVGHIVATCLAFATLARHVPRGAAFVATLPLVFTSCPLHTYILNAPRQAALTLVFVAIFVIDGAAGRRHAIVHAAAGAAIASLACFADPYALLLLPPLVLLGVLVAFDGAPRPAPRLILATFVGALVGVVPFLLLLHSPRSVHGETTLTFAVLRHNVGLLIDPCLPWLLGAAAYVPRDLLGYVEWNPGALVHSAQQLGALVFVVSVVMGGVAFFQRKDPWPVRRLGGFGFLAGVVTVASFLLSVMVMDLFSSRYLAALVLMSPFVLAPLASRVGGRQLFFLLAPYFLAAGLAGWVGYGDEVDGARIVVLPGHGDEDEVALEKMLLERGVRAAIADYWVSYRLTFLYEEAVVVVPIHEREDRYAPYRRSYREATRSAYVFDPKRSREELASMEHEAFEGPHPWGTVVERLHAGSLTAIVFDKPAATLVGGED